MLAQDLIYRALPNFVLRDRSPLFHALDWYARLLQQPVFRLWLPEGRVQHILTHLAPMDEAVGMRQLGRPDLDPTTFAYDYPRLFLREFQGLPPVIGHLHRLEHQLQGSIEPINPRWLEGNRDAMDDWVRMTESVARHHNIAIRPFPPLIARGDHAPPDDVAYFPRVPRTSWAPPAPVAGPS